ncbi:MAG TPA: type II secretion system F family protein, partial [Pirellulales bacterium]|nr:type II secretion system F family protein [Pirellulales bacterium]
MPDVPANETLDLAGAISSLVASGLPIEQGLKAAACELPSGRTARALTAIGERLERGEKLDAILSAEQRALPEHLRALVVAGLRSASLG